MEDDGDINQHMEGLGIDDEENESFVLEDDIEEDVNRYELCLVGRLLTEKNVNVRAMKSKLADVWKPTMGINIKEIEQGLFLFQFFRKEDMLWVMSGGPWSFDNVMVALETVAAGEDPVKVKLWYLNFWIQLHNLPMGYMMESVGKQLGNFFGEFLEYDSKNNTSIWRDCMRIRIRLDIRKPIKRKKKIVKKDGTELMVVCKYERLGEFCFSCGMVTHTDRFCRANANKDGDDGVKEWGSWLRAPPRKVAGQTQSKWLRAENDDTWEDRIGGDSNKQHQSGGKSEKKGKEIRKESDHRDMVVMKGGVNRNTTNSSLAPKFQGFNTTSNLLYGLNEEDNVGLQIEERKRRRSEIEEVGLVDTVMGLQTNVMNVEQNTRGAAISAEDLVEPRNNVLAELARQASHQP